MMTSPCLLASHGKKFYVAAYGAVGDGKHDDTQVWIYSLSLSLSQHFSFFFLNNSIAITYNYYKNFGLLQPMF